MGHGLRPIFACLLLLAGCSDDAAADSTDSDSGEANTTGAATATPSTTATSAPSGGEASGTTSRETTGPSADSSTGSLPSSTGETGDTSDSSTGTSTGGAADCPRSDGDGSALAVTRIGETQVSFDGEPDFVAGVAAIEGGVVLAAQVGEDEVFVGPLEPIPALPGFSTVRSVLARVDEQGDYVWTRLFEATQLGNNNPNAFLRDIDRGPDGTVFTGMTFGNFRLDGGPQTTCSRCAFFGWVDDDGEIAGPHFLSLDAPLITLATSMPDALAIAGANNFPTNFGGAMLNNNSGNAGAGADINIGVFDLDGAHLWSRRWGGEGTERIGGLDTTLDGDLVLSGTTDGQIDFGGGLLGGGDAQPPDVVVARLAGVDGEHVWSRVFETFATDASPSFSVETRAVVQDDVVIVSISAREMAVDIDGEQEVAAGHILALDVSTGDTVWKRSFDGPLEIRGIDARCDGIAVTGSYTEALSYGADAAPTPAGEDAFVMMISVEDGSMRWLQTMTDATQGAAIQTGLDVALGDDGSLWWGGEFSGDINLGTGLVQSGMGSPRPDGFVARLDP